MVCGRGYEGYRCPAPANGRSEECARQRRGESRYNLGKEYKGISDKLIG